MARVRRGMPMMAGRCNSDAMGQLHTAKAQWARKMTKERLARRVTRAPHQPVGRTCRRAMKLPAVISTTPGLKKSITHYVYTPNNSQGGNYAGYYVLKPYGEDNGWMLPYAMDEIEYNNGELVNTGRPERENEDPAFRLQ